MKRSMILKKIFIEIRSRYIFYKARRFILENKSLSAENVKRIWWDYLQPLWRILKTFEKNYQADANDRRITRRRGRGLHLFTILSYRRGSFLSIQQLFIICFPQ